MTIHFHKYQGTGNDFIIIDNRLLFFDKNDTKLIRYICDRKFGIGADGLLVLEHCDTADFKMVYFNADGKEGSMCGNGGRCMVAFASFLGIVDGKAMFTATDGMHHATLTSGVVKLKMQDISVINSFPQYTFLDTGSPHHVQMVENLEDINVKALGRQLRYGKYGESGSNINFVSKHSESMFAVRTYERGVEDETLSCGTGVTAVALAMHYINKTKANRVTLQTLGGDLNVSFEQYEKGYRNIHLEGPAQYVFKGEITW